VGLRLPVLLAARLFEVVRVVRGTHLDLERAVRREELGDVDGERSVAALVPRRELPVEPHGRVVVDGFEVQEPALAVRGRLEAYGAAVPACMKVARRLDPARPALG
jgi:hypothetical protein